MQARYLIGTLFEEEELNKKMNYGNVKLKDPMGNTRWKGAFTGGFEAGYKNTCGSKQGWTPSSFVSSVGKKQEMKEQNIFDFMDKEDLGRESISKNISTTASFTPQLHTSSIPQQILKSFKAAKASLKEPENAQELQQLLKCYENAEEIEKGEPRHSSVLKGLDGYAGVPADKEPQQDDFIDAYLEVFRKVIRAGYKEETEEEIQKRREENKIYFDFTRPIDEEPEYLKEIQDIEEASKPKKRRRNTINDKKLKDLFRMGSKRLQIQTNQQVKDQIPEGYDPYHRIKNMKETDRKLIAQIQEKKGNKFLSLSQRSDLLNENKLTNRFVSAGTKVNASSNSFVRAGQEEHSKGLEKVFEDVNKNKRYWDYVMELEGQKISAQLNIENYEESQKQKQQFQKKYNLLKLSKSTVPKKVEEALKAGTTTSVKFVRKSGNWKPEKLLCKRFGCFVPYKEDKPVRDKNQRHSDHF